MKSRIRREKKKRIRRVAVLVNTATNWGRGILTGINEYALRKDNMQILSEPRGPGEELRLPTGWQGDGVIARITSAEMVTHLEASRLPVVNVSGIHLPRQPFPLVTSDMEQIARYGANFFFESGFRHFAYLSLKGLEYVSRQQEAFVRAVEEKGYRCAVRKIPTYADSQVPDWKLDVRELGEWIGRLPKPLAILTWSGGQEIVLACQHAGLRIPDEVALLSAMDDFLCQIVSPSISAIESDCRGIGHEAARLLSAMMDGESTPEQAQLFPPLRVIARQSTDTLAIDDPVLATALRFIREEAARPIRISEIVRHAGVSRRVLERRFAEKMQRTPGEELRRCRLARATVLLEQTKLPIAEVAERSGFGSPEYLTYVFRKRYSMSPLRYRNAHSAELGPEKPGARADFPLF